jgi:hypothetical protein
MNEENKEQIDKNKRVKKWKKQHDDSSDESGDDAECLYCGEFYSKSIEGWISCVTCKKWAHTSCADVDSEDDEVVLICEICQNK